jgi:hypothetical protein
MPHSLTNNTGRIFRVTVVLFAVAALMLMWTQLAHAQPATPTPVPQPSGGGAVNPFDGISPDIGLFGPALNSTWKRLLAAVWGACIAITGFYVLTSFLKVRKARGRNMPSDLSDASDDLKLSFYALGGTAAVSPIIGALLLLVQPGA